jgi:hypothetical protein
MSQTIQSTLCRHECQGVVFGYANGLGFFILLCDLRVFGLEMVFVAVIFKKCA